MSSFLVSFLGEGVSEECVTEICANDWVEFLIMFENMCLGVVRGTLTGPLTFSLIGGYISR